MFFKKIFLTFLILIFLYSCTNKNILFIENDNYSKFCQYYYNDIVLSLNKFKLIGGFNSQDTFEHLKKIISTIKNKDLNKVNVYAIIFYPYGKENNTWFNNIFNYTNNLESFLLKEKNYTNNFYVLGVPQCKVNKFLVLIYFSKDLH